MIPLVRRSAMTILSALRFSVIAVLLCSFFVTPASLSAQGSSSPEQPPPPVHEEDTYYAIGLQASLLSGAGLSGRLVMNDFTLQATTFIIAVSSITHFNLGLEGHYSFTKGPSGRLYGLVGGGYYLTTSSDSSKPGNRIAEPIRLGLGVGGDINASRNFVFDGSLAFHWFVATGKVLPLPTLGFHYYFR